MAKPTFKARIVSHSKYYKDKATKTELRGGAILARVFAKLNPETQQYEMLAKSKLADLPGNAVYTLDRLAAGMDSGGVITFEAAGFAPHQPAPSDGAYPDRFFTDRNDPTNEALWEPIHRMIGVERDSFAVIKTGGVLADETLATAASAGELAEIAY